MFRGLILHQEYDHYEEDLAEASVDVTASSEVDANKGGCSIADVPDENVQSINVYRGKEYVELDDNPYGIITIFVREKSWLVARRIFNDDGTVWKPTIDPTPFDVDDFDNAPASASQTVQRNSKRSRIIR